VYAGLLRGVRRQWAILLGSVVAIYWLQPPLPIRFSDFILPTATIALTVIIWLFTRQQDSDEQAASAAQDRKTLLVIALLVVGLSFMRFVEADYRITASRPPSPLAVLVGLLLLGGVVAIAARMWQGFSGRRHRDVLTGLILLLLALFVLLKTEALASGFSRWWRSLSRQDTTLAGPIDLAWLGFSFVAFRLIHTLRDRQSGILPAMSLLEYVSYVIFFPAYTAGPIDRAERFVSDFRALPALTGLDAARLGEGAWRITLGLLKKFVIADSLAQGMALTATNAQQTHSTLGLWVLLYGYALRLYFDFAGYSDIAIGIGILFGIRLPENFRRPYLRTNITEFWQSWHITLSNWVRSYVFIPLSRWLLRRSWRPSSTLIVLAAQMATMIVIGLWHGFTWNFFIWGIWHGLALFVHKQWSDRTRKWHRGLANYPNRKRAWSLASWFLTFQYVVLGWVWFALPTVDLSLKVYAGLFGLGD
jgi:D-alanyl-lipoteichoic acid acyltransferase DltB (MBOAT superfamily)